MTKQNCLKCSEFLSWNVLLFVLLQETMRVLFACLLLVLLFAAPLSKGAEESQYERFIKHHINFNMTEGDCDDVIRTKQIYKPTGSCKERNTFILSKEETVKSICNGIRYDNVTSWLLFRIVDCKLKEGDMDPDCKYNGRSYDNKHIKIVCEDSLPVHFIKFLTI